MSTKDIKEWLGIIIVVLASVISVTVSHVRLEGQIKLLTATNKIEHDFLKERLNIIIPPTAKIALNQKEQTDGSL